jgi:geranylgeranyl diphosphate synthase type I
MIEYHLGWRNQDLVPLAQRTGSGKRLRGILALLVSEAVCGSIAPARRAAIAVELVHNFSLVHDDIQDRSHLRRHRPTIWSLWGLEHGITAGDWLWAVASEILVRPSTPGAAVQAEVLAEACLRLIEGQFLDLELQRSPPPPTPAMYSAMIDRKTGALFAAACRMGALASEASSEQTAAYARFGLRLGRAFQEQDDLLGVWGTSESTGKPERADLLDRKRGLPAVIALTREGAPAWLAAAYAGDAPMEPATAMRVREHFDLTGVRAEVEARVRADSAAALEALSVAGAREPARGHLAAITLTLQQREA